MAAPASDAAAKTALPAYARLNPLLHRRLAGYLLAAGSRRVCHLHVWNLRLARLVFVEAHWSLSLQVWAE